MKTNSPIRIQRCSLLLLCAAALVCFAALAPKADAQVSFHVQIGTPPPVCPYGYYDYSPYACAPAGFYGPGYFYNGIFLGVGPWAYWGYRHGWGPHRFYAPGGGHYFYYPDHRPWHDRDYYRHHPYGHDNGLHRGHAYGHYDHGTHGHYDRGHGDRGREDHGHDDHGHDNHGHGDHDHR